ncbi:MAG: glycoside hydrolase domain-containing protein [Armatimonadota bacterium]
MRRLLPLFIALVPLAVFAGNAGDANWPRLTILPLGTAPVIDGKVAPEEWSGAVTVPGFTQLRQTNLISNQPLVKLAWSPEALLVAASIPLPPGQRARAAATDFDGTVWNDDSVEVHVDAGHQHKKNHQFVVNALGTHFDSLAGDAKWNGPWEAKAQNTPGQWSCEFAIPWSTVGGAPKAGEVGGFNVIINSSYLGGTLSFAALKGSAHDTSSFAHVVYGNAAALSVEGLDGASRELSLQRIGTGPVAVKYSLTGGDGKVLEAETYQVEGAVVTVPINLPQDPGGGLKPGHYAVALTATGPAGLLLARQASLVVEEALRVELSAFTQGQTLELFLRPEQSMFPDADTSYDIRLTGEKGYSKQWQHKREGKQAATTADLRLEGKDLPDGKLTLRVAGTNAKTGMTRTVERVMEENPLRPAWLGTREGLTDKVPAPWTAMVFDAKNAAVRCWGRAYVFDKGPLPAQVKTRNASVLARPISFTGKVDGQTLDWTSGGYTTYDVAKNQITLFGSARAGEQADFPLKMEGMARTDYDGMMRVDVTLTPTKAGAKCDDLTLEIPLKTANARYLYHFPGRWGSVANSAFVPKEGWTNAFKPYVWLGDEDRGFSWFCESDENWFPLNNPKALEVRPEGAVTYLRCHLIATETTLDKPLKYTFGFQATPVKQPEKTVWDYRITHHGGYGLEKQNAVTGGKITYPVTGNINREEGTFECWYRPAVDSEREKAFADRTYQGNREIFSVNVSAGMNGTNYGLYWNGTVQGLVGWARTDGIVTMNPQTNFDWKGGEWRHLGMTWDKQFVRIYLDGKMICETPNKGFLAGDIENGKIVIGGDGSLASIDEVRILSVARPPVVPEKPYEADAQTLLLDDMDGYGGNGTAGTDGGKAGTAGEAGVADAWLKFIPGKFGKAVTWEPERGKKRLQELYDLGVRTICFHEHWVPYQSYPHVTEENRPKLRSLADGMKAQKLDLLLYMSRQFADNSPEWELYNKEACIEPRPGPYTRMPAQKAYLACWNGPYRDFALHWLGKTMDEFGNAGWYLDGPEWPMPCSNRSHGCGYVTADGTVRPTWDIFATREFMQRLYVLTRQRNPQGQLNIHNSTVMTTPTLAFGTSTWGGEQIDAIKPPVKTLEIFPMDSFRTEFMGRQWGIPAEFLVYEGSPYYSKDVLAYTLLHEVPIRPGAPDALDRTSALWKVHDEFPFSHGEMLGYWNNAQYIKVGPEGVYASIWRIPKRGALVVVSNLSDADAQAQVALDLQKLASGKKITDALTGEALANVNGKLTLPVASWRYRVLRVK